MEENLAMLIFWCFRDAEKANSDLPESLFFLLVSLLLVLLLLLDNNYGVHKI